MSVQVEIRSEAPKHKVLLSGIRNAAVKMLRTLGWKEAELSLLLTTDSKIRKIHREFMDDDTPTDVITFGAHAGKCSPRHGGYMGDIVVSLDTAKRRSGEFGNTFSYETLFYICHGILHLMGHDDSTKAKSKKMLLKQARVLKKSGVERLSVVIPSPGLPRKRRRKQAGV